MVDVLSFAEVLAKVRGPPFRAFALRNLSRSYCSTRKLFYRTRVSSQDVAASTFQQLGENLSVICGIHRIARQSGTKTSFEPGRSCRVAKDGSDLG